MPRGFVDTLRPRRLISVVGCRSKTLPLMAEGVEVQLAGPIQQLGNIMSEIQVRRIFLQADAVEIQCLQLNAPEFEKHYPKHNEWLRIAISEIVTGKRFAFGVYKTTFNERGQPIVSLVGSIILKKETYSHVIQLKNLYIKPEERRRKYGRALFEAVEQFCIKKGWITIETEVPCAESGTVNFLNIMRFFVQNLVESPYRKGDQLYRMYKHLPRKYTGDPFDLFNLSCWLFENLYSFRIVSATDPNVHFVSNLQFDFETTNNTQATQIQGTAYVIDESNPVSIDRLGVFHKNNKKHLLSVIARNFSPDARRFCKNQRILALDTLIIEKELRSIFAAELPSFPKEHIQGMIVPINSKYFSRLIEHTGVMTYFKGGPIGKYLKAGDLILFYVEQSSQFTDGGLRAYAEVITCEVNSPDLIWEKYENSNPIFPKEDYFAWSVDKSEVIALTFSKINMIEPIPYGKINEQVTQTSMDNEKLGNFYLSQDEVSKFLRNKTDYAGLINLDKSLSPKIFLSSTISDLREEREFVIRLIKDNLNYNVFASEAAGAKQTARPSVLDELNQSQIYICLVGERFGYEIEVEGRKLSATHDEFIHARKFNKHILVYVKRMPNREQKVVDFLKEIGSYQTGIKYQEFSTTQELGQHITLDIARIVSGALSKSS